MSKVDAIKPTGRENLYKVEIQVEGEWVAMMLLKKQSIVDISDIATMLSDRDVEEALK